MSFFPYSTNRLSGKLSSNLSNYLDSLYLAIFSPFNFYFIFCPLRAANK